MTDYRLYFLDSRKRIQGVQELDCGDDAQAMRSALALADGRAMELWQLDRRVGAIDTTQPGVAVEEWSGAAPPA